MVKEVFINAFFMEQSTDTLQKYFFSKIYRNYVDRMDTA